MKKIDGSNMENKKIKIISMLLLALCVFIMMIFAVKNKKENIVFSNDYIMVEELPALLSFTHYDLKSWQEKVADIAEGKLEYGELEHILELLGIEKYITYKSGSKFSKVTREEFFQIYTQLLDILDVEEKVKKMDLLFVVERAKEGEWVTQKGYKEVIGGKNYIEPYDMYQAYIIEGTVIGLEGKSTESIIWKNIFIHSTKGKKVELLYEQEFLTIDIADLSEEVVDTICDIEWRDGVVTAIYKKEETIQGTVLSYGNKKIEISGYGSLKYQGDLKIYKTYGTLEQLDEAKLMIGNLKADFVVAEGKVCGIILREPAEIQKIRVLLLNGESPYYSEIYLKATKKIILNFAGKQQKIPANTVIKVSDYWMNSSEGYLELVQKNEQSNIFLTDAQGNAISLGYQGDFEIRKYQEGYGIVNELSLEDYLCAVVPSEMPASYEKEALRAQAVCARSYACMQLVKGEYAGFGANVDDGTSYQVYNKQERNAATTLAVQDTVGEVLHYNGKIAEAYYYSTSCGFSQNIDVWNIDSGEEYGYLQSACLLKEDPEFDFSKEEVFAEFIKNKDYIAYDSEYAYFRWSAKVDISAFEQQINQALLGRKNVNADNVQCFDTNGELWEKSPADMGKIVGLQPEERSSGGVLKSLRIQYEKGSILLKTEYNIRKILGVAVAEMTDKNGNDIKGMTLLPSAAFTVVPVEQGYVLYGGGYGHGIGLSQNGANGMAKEGFIYTDILQKFYHNIQIENIYNNRDGL